MFQGWCRAEFEVTECPPTSPLKATATLSLGDDEGGGKDRRDLEPIASKSPHLGTIWCHDQRCRIPVFWRLTWPKPPVFLSHFDPLYLESNCKAGTVNVVDSKALHTHSAQVLPRVVCIGQRMPVHESQPQG